MQRYIATRALYGVVTLVALTLVVFILGRLSGDPRNVLLPIDAGPEVFAAAAKAYGLDRPLPVQYFIYLKDLAQGNLGNSIAMGRPVLEIVVARIPATVQLASASFAIALVIGVPLGILSAKRRGTWLDGFARTFAVLGQSVPVFWLGIVLSLILGVRLHLLPTSGYGGLKYYILPAFCMGWFTTAALMRLVRSGMVDALESEYIKMAKIKGVPPMQITLIHALKNGALPAVTMAGWQFATLLGGSLVTETVFAWPGIGLLAWNALRWRDFPLLQGVVLFIGIGFVLLDLLVDILYAYLDPRIRHG
ncbi:MAG: ABC transporter permease [Dehalococcoidia bacterium]|nr:ABC transporter permease [Dehalococcoidia bacterium]